MVRNFEEKKEFSHFRSPLLYVVYSLAVSLILIWVFQLLFYMSRSMNPVPLEDWAYWGIVCGVMWSFVAWYAMTLYFFPKKKVHTFSLYHYPKTTLYPIEDILVGLYIPFLGLIYVLLGIFFAFPLVTFPEHGANELHHWHFYAGLLQILAGIYILISALSLYRSKFPTSIAALAAAVLPILVAWTSWLFLVPNGSIGGWIFGISVQLVILILPTTYLLRRVRMQDVIPEKDRFNTHMRYTYPTH